MKKLFGAIIFFLSIVIIISSCADEIQFRGIEWGVSPDNARKQIDDPDLYMQQTYTYGFIAYPSKTVERLLDRSKNYIYDNYEFFSQKECLTIVSSMFTITEAKVGGYKLDHLNMYFVNEVKNGKINKSKKKLHFAVAEYTFDILDGNAAYSELKTKLSKLYEAGKEITDSYDGSLWYDGKGHDYTVNTSIIAFNGDNGTHAQLINYETIAAADPDKPTYQMTLTYWCDKYEKMIREADKILAQEEYDTQLQEEKNANQDDFGGL